MSKLQIETSKFLSYVLRHAPEEIGLHLDGEGWADIGAVIEGARRVGRDLDEALIRAVVESSDKKRFTISADGLRIRAAQGHSVENVSITYEEKVPPTVLFHGTAARFLESILREGLKPQDRHHVHLSADVNSAIAVGKRHGKPVVLRVDSLRMHREGFKFSQAENGVWLAQSVPGTYLSQIATGSVSE